MFKKLVLMSIFLSLPCMSYAAENQKISETVVSSDSSYLISVPQTYTNWTKSISSRQVPLSDPIAVAYRATSSAGINLKIEMEQSDTVPNTESLYDEDYITSDTVDASVVDTNWHMKTMDTVVMPYFRFKITGQGSNHYSTLIKMKVVK